MLTNIRGAEIKRLKFSAAAASTTLLVPAVTGKTIFVHGVFLDTIDNSNTVSFKSDGVSISPDFFMASKGDSIILPVFESGWFATSVSKALSLTAEHAAIGLIIYTQE